jgi:AcrR family transcriptional regulator
MAKSPALDLSGLPDETLVSPGALIRERAVRAARSLLQTEGLDVSMDQIAETSGVGRRTLFRYFATRDALLREGIESTLRWYGEELTNIIEVREPLHEWLRSVVQQVHEIHLAAGKAVWQLTTASENSIPAEFSKLNGKRQKLRQEMTGLLADRAWSAYGGTGQPPEAVVDAIRFVVSSFAAQGMIVDQRRPVRAVAESGAVILEATIRAHMS